MINNQLKLLSLFFCVIILLFIFFKLNFNKNNLVFISFIFLILLIQIFFYFSNIVLKIQILIFASTFYLLSFILELNYDRFFYSMCRSNECKELKKNEIQKKIDEKLNYNLLPKIFINDDLDLMPLSTFKKTYVLGSNENKYYPYFFTDRYGFLNEDDYYNKDFQDILIIGDSYAMGATVNYEHTLQGHLIKKGYKTISFGMGGNGPLMALGSLIEFKREVNPKKIIYMFSATNDVGYDLFLEKRNKILIQYLNKGYKQDLLSKNQKIEKLLINKYAELLNLRKENSNMIIDKIKLSKVRYLFGLENKGKQNSDSEYDDKLLYTLKDAINSDDLNSNYFLLNKILKRMKDESKNSEFYIFYVPERKKFFQNKKSNTYYAIRKMSEKNNIKLIDIFNNPKTENYKLRKSMYPKNFAHPNEKGYEIWSEIIAENIKLLD